MVSHVTDLNKFEYLLHLKMLLIHNQSANGLGAPPQQVDSKVVPAYEQFANLHSEKLLHALTVMNHIDIDFACMYNKLQDWIKLAWSKRHFSYHPVQDSTGGVLNASV